MSDTGVYDWWSRHPRALDALYGLAFLGREDECRGRAIERCALRSGDRVLEIGCGNGIGFRPLRDGVGSTGTVVGLDVSRGMVQRATQRIDDAAWANVHAIRADARRPPLPDDSFDVAYAAMSLSAVPEPNRAITAAKRVLRPGGRFVVLDARPFEQWPWTLANVVVGPLAKAATDWVPQVDLLAGLRREFEHVDAETFNGGSILVALARTRADA
jgi:demethylmenaquinone methyltransferase/2-methoxy-6-polyprenyl-1,4-benzoquinol methylase